MKRVYHQPLKDFPHTLGQAAVALAVALGQTNSGEISRGLNLPRRSVQRVLAMLVRLGLVELREQFSRTGRQGVWVAVQPDLWRWVVLVPATQILARRGFSTLRLAKMARR